MKHEWRKKEKHLYFPKEKPEIIDIPEMQYISIKGQGNPNSPIFVDYLQAMYSVAYTIKMRLKHAEKQPKNYTDWTVYPLEGIWDITEEAKKNFNGKINKDDLVFELMIRQPDFISPEIFKEKKDLAFQKKGFDLIQQVELKKITEGKCIQMLHIGSFDNEPATFAIMEDFAKASHVVRQSKLHREIYLSDFKKIPEHRLKTVLRIQLES